MPPTTLNSEEPNFASRSDNSSQPTPLQQRYYHTNRLHPMALPTNIGQTPANEKTPDLSNPESKWSGRRESNPPLKLGKLPFYR